MCYTWRSYVSLHMVLHIINYNNNVLHIITYDVTHVFAYGITHVISYATTHVGMLVV